MAYGASTAPHFSVSHAARVVLDMLEAAGYESWIVGGFVRDALRGEPSADIDIATAAPWPDVARIAQEHGAYAIETGVAHGTVTVVVDHTPVEVTTFRVDGPYRDGRHPEDVSFTSSIAEDLARRDFTINAIAYHPERGLFDPYDGAGDIGRRIIKTVGDPHARLSEDALRILRACRFASQLGFAVDDKTARAMRSVKHLLARVSVERIAHEFERLLIGPHAGDALLENGDVLAVVMPEIVACIGLEQRSPYHCYDVFEHIARTVDAAPATPLVRWAAFCHDLGKPATASFDENGTGHFYGHARVSAALTTGIMRRLHMPSVFSDHVVFLVRHHDDEIPSTPRGAKRILAKGNSNVALVRALCDLKRADALAHAPDHQGGVALADELERAIDGVLARREAFAVKDLAIGGRDVMDLGIAEGPVVGHALAAALDAVIDEQVENDRDALRAFVRSWARANAD